MCASQSLENVLELSRRLPWVRPVLDFAHLHAVTDGGFTSADAFAGALAAADAVLEPAVPFHIHFCDIAYANRNCTLRAEPLAAALRRCGRRRRSSPSPPRGVEPDDPSDPRPPAARSG